MCFLYPEKDIKNKKNDVRITCNYKTSINGHTKLDIVKIKFDLGGASCFDPRIGKWNYALK